MAKPTKALITALLDTVARLQAGAPYQWGHMGSCNCGHLVQSLTRHSREEIHRAALMRAGDWGQQSIDYCPTSGYPLDHILSTVLQAGLERDDIDHLERLGDLRVLRRLPLAERDLKRNKREDVIVYMRTWAQLLIEQHDALYPQAPYTHPSLASPHTDASDGERVDVSDDALQVA